MIAIVTDGTCDLPPNILQDHHIRVVPLYVHFGDSTFRAGLDITNEQFLYRLQTSIELPTTEPPKVEDFQELYKQLLGECDQIISIHISSKLSKTYANALAARQALDDPDIHVVDSLSVSGGLGLMALKAAHLAAAGQPVEAVLRQVEMMATHHRAHFIVNTLEYLQRGGRIGRARALLGTFLRMKPILTIQEGEFEPLETVRTKPKAVARLRQMVIDGLAGHSHVYMAVCHSAAPDEAQRLAEDLVVVVEPEHSLVCEIGPVVATHAGPGTLGVAFYSSSGRE